MAQLKFPSNENSLLKAFAEITKNKINLDRSDYIAEYSKNFTTLVEPIKNPPPFVRFSIVDQTISVIVKSTSI
jgi:hypothetical protein